MKIITGYFDNNQQALNTAQHLRNHKFKGEISVIGQHNDEAFLDGKILREDSDDKPGMTNMGLAGGVIGGTLGFASLAIPGLGPLLIAGPIAGLVGGALGGEFIASLLHMGVSEEEGREIKKIIQSGNTVLLIKSDEDEEQLVRDTLKDKGGKSI